MGDPRGGLFSEVFAFVVNHKPAAFILEHAPHLEKQLQWCLRVDDDEPEGHVWRDLQRDM